MTIVNTMNRLLLACTLYACGHIGNHTHHEAHINTTMIENDIVRRAIEAWQAGDSRVWLSCFTHDAKLFDDGSSRDFKTFSTETIGHERFISMDKIADNGTCIYGEFHSDRWGDFKTYFRFHIGDNGKIDRLDIGQADY